jgi:DNA-binding CsgD family transcriptional regulator
MNWSQVFEQENRIDVILSDVADRMGFRHYFLLSAQADRKIMSDHALASFGRDCFSKLRQEAVEIEDFVFDQYDFDQPHILRHGANERVQDGKAIGAIVDELAQQGSDSSILVSAYGPYTETSILGFSNQEYGDDFEQLCDAYRDDLRLICILCHQKVLRGRSQDQSSPLTTRERECLLCVARGKSSWEVSQILEISEQTVVFHLKNSMKKLEVFNRTHAVVRSIQMGLINP